MRSNHIPGERRFRSDAGGEVPTGGGPENGGQEGVHGRHGGHRGHGGPGGGRRGGPGGFGGRGGPGGPGGRGGRGFGRPGGWQQADLPPADDAVEWLTGRLPEGWFVSAPQVAIDREEITVIGELPPLEGDAAGSESAAIGRITRFREETRDARVKIADEAEARYGRKVAWGASIGETAVVFTHLSVPVMTRLRQSERQVLDTLVDAGVARSRSEALAWSVKLVGEHTEEWLAGLRNAMAEVDKLRTEGPTL
ncbi:hypothetical protein SAMN05444157_1246 [Frankineae bacterium MT45]|nr:hypothetical protein SAMN05444157_1246 [Frankineae bacterium MT45]